MFILLFSLQFMFVIFWIIGSIDFMRERWSLWGKDLYFPMIHVRLDLSFPMIRFLWDLSFPMIHVLLVYVHVVILSLVHVRYLLNNRKYRVYEGKMKSLRERSIFSDESCSLRSIFSNYSCSLRSIFPDDSCSFCVFPFSYTEFMFVIFWIIGDIEFMRERSIFPDDLC